MTHSASGRQAGQVGLLAATLVLALAASAGAATVTACQSEREATGRDLASAISAGGLIVFQCPPGTTLDIRAAMTVSRPVVIDGGGQVTLRLARESGPAFVVQPGVTFEARRIALRGTELTFFRLPADYAGLVLAPDATVTLRNTNITQSTLPIRTHTLVLEEATFEDTTSRVSAVAATVERSRFIGGFSGISVNGGPLSISGSEFRDQKGLAITVAGPGCGLRVRNSTFTNVSSIFPQSAIEIAGCSTEIANSRFSNNKSLRGGALYISAAGQSPSVLIRNTTFEDNSAREVGGAIALADAGNITLKIQLSTFRRNRAPIGGAIGSDALTGRHFLRIARTVFDANVATEAGGSLGLRNVLFDGSQILIKAGQAPLGAAIYSAVLLGGGARLSNSIVNANAAPGGNIIAFTGAFEAVNSTLTGNTGVGFSDRITGGDDAAIRQQPQADALRLSLRNTIIAGNIGESCAVRAEGISSLQYPDGSCGNTVAVVDPLLDPMFVPLPGGPALGHGDNDVCASEPVMNGDFYSQRRPQGLRCSIGAVEGEITSVMGAVMGRRSPAQTGQVPFQVPEPPVQEEPTSPPVKLPR